MSNQIPLIDSHNRNMSLVYSVEGVKVSFFLSRFDGHSFIFPKFAPDALQSELEKKFIEIADLFEGY